MKHIFKKIIITILVILVILFLIRIFNSISFEVKYHTVERNGKLAIFNQKNQQLTNYVYDEVYESTYVDPKELGDASLLTTFPRYGLTLVRKDKEFAFLNEQFKEVLPFGTYDLIKPMNYYGYSIVRKNSKWGVLDKSLKLVVPLKFDMISQSLEVENYSFIAKNGNKYRILDKKANWILKTEFDSIEIVNDNFYLCYLGYKKYLINDESKLISDQYSAFYSLNDGFIVKKDTKMGVVNFENNIVIPFDYDSIYAPHLTPYFYASKGGRFGVIDLKGKTLIPFEYEGFWESSENTKDKNNLHLIAQKNGKYGTINFKNKIVTPFIYDAISSWIEYGPPAHYIIKDKKWGLISYEGKVLIPTIYDHLHYITDSLIKCKKQGKSGVLDINNRVVVPCENDSLIVDYFFLPRLDKKEYKIVIKKNGSWKFLNLKGKLIKDNVSETEVKSYVKD